MKNPPALQDTPVRFLNREDPLEKGRLPTPVFLGFPCGSAGKESACNTGDLSLISGLGRSPEERKGYALQYSGLENSMDCMVQGVTESDTTEQLSHSFQPWFGASQVAQWVKDLPAMQEMKAYVISIPGSGRSAEGIGYPLQYSWASLVAQLVKNLPGMWETWV